MIPISQVLPVAQSQYILLDKVPDVQQFLRTLNTLPTFAIDLEADSLYSYREKTCLVQISTPSANVILDPLAAREGMQDLGPLLADRTIRKVFHGADYDIRLLKKDYGFEIHHVADTMIAAQLAGRAMVGLAALLSEEFGLELDKQYQKANWVRRPLDRKLLHYAAVDTAYLLDLWQRLRARLVELGRLEWAEEEFGLLEEATPAPAHEPSCFDVKGASRLSPRELCVLQNLVQVRDQAARSWDRPPFKVLSNQTLLFWAQSPPRRLDEVLQTPAANLGTLRHLAQQVLQAVQKAKETPLSSCPHRDSTRFIPLSNEQRERLARLRLLREQVAQRLELNPGLLTSSDTLEKLSRSPREQAAGLLDATLKRWQKEVLGAEIMAILVS